MRKLYLIISLNFAIIAILLSNGPHKVSDSSAGRHVQILKLFDLHNVQREENKKKTFQLDLDLQKAAQLHAQWMASKNNLTHQGFSQRIPVGWMTAGENIAFNQVTEQEVTEDWMNSSGHRANILNKDFNSIGFGYEIDRKGQIYWCTIFGGHNMNTGK